MTTKMTCRFESGGKRISLLGYGAMRLPTADGGHANNWAKDGYSSTGIDQEEMNRQVKYLLEHPKVLEEEIREPVPVEL